jgi:hypothetical protein
VQTADGLLVVSCLLPVDMQLVLHCSAWDCMQDAGGIDAQVSQRVCVCMVGRILPCSIALCSWWLAGI